MSLRSKWIHWMYKPWVGGKLLSGTTSGCSFTLLVGSCDLSCDHHLSLWREGGQYISRHWLHWSHLTLGTGWLTSLLLYRRQEVQAWVLSERDVVAWSSALMPCSWCDCSSPSSFLLRYGAPDDVFTDTMRCLSSGPTMCWWSATAEASSSLM